MKRDELLKFLEKIPLHLRKGPWSVVAHLYLLGFLLFLVFTLQYAVESYDEIKEPPTHENVTAFRMIAGIWGVFVTVAIIISTGWWPLMSYTLTSWNLLWLRMLCATLADHYGVKSASYWARCFKFPALVGCTITVTVWWLALVPLINHLMEEKYRSGFWKFNFSFMLLNVHLLNLPIAVVEFYLSSSRLVYFDLWIGLVICFAYVIFYLNVLDPRQLHFYIVFTPRTYLCFIPYTIVLTIYYGCYVGWNNIIVG